MLSLVFDEVTFVNTALGAILGGLISVGISYYFFLRGKGLETLTKWLSHNIGDANIQQQYPQFFGALGASGIPNESAPTNSDIPRLQFVKFSPQVATPGGVLEVLCRVVDEGWNFPSSSGGLVIVAPDGHSHAVNGVGFGYMLAAIPIAENHQPGCYQLAFNMHDIDKSSGQRKNSFTQTVNFEVR